MNTQPSFRLEAFEGPLDLLLSLIEKNKINIFDIPIALILEQYNEYIESAKLRDMNVAAEFIEMSARLIQIKCRLLLPKTGGDDPREELVRDLLLYAQMKNAAIYLDERYGYFGDRYEKDPEIILAEEEESDPAPENLFPASVLPRILREIAGNYREKLRHYNIAERILPKRPRVSLSEKYIYILRKAYGTDKLTFADFLKIEGSSVRIDDVTAALNAVLRLVMSGTLICGEGNILECKFELNRKKRKRKRINS